MTVHRKFIQIIGELDMSQETRKNFPIETIEKTYEKQGHACLKCGLPLTYGYIVHHINGDNSDISEENCGLLHVRCHESELWKTLKVQRERALGYASAIMDSAVKGVLNGALVKELNELLDKISALQNQLYGIEHFELAAKDRVEYSEAVARTNLDAFMAGYQEALKQIPELLKGNVVKIAK